MKIHTVNRGEKIRNIADKYGAGEENLRLINEIPHGEATEGEELLIITPTRTHRLRGGESVSGIAHRYGVEERELYLMNPWLSESGGRQGDVITIRWGEEPLGGSLGVGYVYRGCEAGALRRALPYLTYAVVASGISEGGKVYSSYPTEKERTIIKEAGCVPLLRIFEKEDALGHGLKISDYADEIIRLARDEKFEGVVLPLQGKHEKGYAELLSEMKKRLNEAGLIFMIETDENTESEFSRSADGSLFSYMKCHGDVPLSFPDGERRAIADYACKGDGARGVIEIPSIARAGDGFISTKEAIRIARSAGCNIETDEKTLLSSFDSRRMRCVYPSLKNIKATLDLIHEFGFIGTSFDIMRTPLNHMIMYGAMFKPYRQTRERASEGCSRE